MKSDMESSIGGRIENSIENNIENNTEDCIDNGRIYALKTENLTKCYGKFKALDALSMHVPKGAIYGFVGRNGAGKTTLIRVICGLVKASSGAFSLNGIPADRREIVKSRRHLGAVIETPALYRNMTAEENLKMQYLILGLPSFEGIYELLRLVGLDDSGKKKVRDFSLGMKQRLALAIALAGDPDFLLLDEPVNGLDPQGIVEMRELILKLNRERQITVLISSHNLNELSRIATHYGIIDHGRMIRELSAEELFQLCRKCVRMEVSDTAALARVLDGLHFQYRILSENMADVFSAFSVTNLVLALHKENCEVLTMTERDESLESYFFSLTGGGAK